MLSYQHGYHAGNFADVMKHFTLTRLLTYLKRKDKPFLYFETHAGRGLYDLRSKESRKTLEYQNGIKKVWGHRNDLSGLFAPFLQCIRTLNPEENLTYYPGSPLIATLLLEKTERLILCEKHPKEFRYLETMPTYKKRIFCYHEDGLSQLRAFFPPPERRALLFIDPPFEENQEYDAIPKAIADAYARFPTGMICLWYPIIDQWLHQKLIKSLSRITPNTALNVEWYLSQTITSGLQACGLYIVNPPYVLAHELQRGLSYLQTIIPSKTPSFSIKNI